MYWMAYSQVKLKEFDLAKDTIERLLKTYEKTKWKGDAEMLLAQVPNGVRVKVAPITVTVDPVEVEVRTQDLQDRIKEAQELAQQRAQASQEREQERDQAPLERMND